MPVVARFGLEPGCKVDEFWVRGGRVVIARVGHFVWRSD